MDGLKFPEYSTEVSTLERRQDQTMKGDSDKQNNHFLRRYNVFYCYAHEDKTYRDKLNVHLSPLKRQGYINAWYDKDILPGATWEKEINVHLETADFILLLISPDFIHSDYCYGIEMNHALKKHDRGEAYVLPIIVRPVDWEETPIKGLQVLPTEGKPITEWYNRDKAYQDVVKGLRKKIEEIRKNDDILFSAAIEIASECKKLSMLLLKQRLNTNAYQSYRLLKALQESKIINDDYELIFDAILDKNKKTQNSRYASLALWLQSRPPQVKSVTLCFKDVEEIIEVSLPPSARKHGAFWSNNLERNPQARRWCDVGWQVTSVKMKDELVIFSRIS